MKPPVDEVDLALVRRTLAGDEAAFQEILRKYQRRIFRICYRITGCEATAEDAAQEAFVRAYFALRRFDQSRPLLPWLVRIAVNRAISTAAHESPYVALPESFSETPAGDQEAAARSAELARAAAEAVAALPPKLRVVLTLRVFEELSYQEIADTLDISIGTVMSRLSRGRDRIREKLRGLL
ncbi:MAG: sigma-70 family RNA polymerase sigma factor [Acidobacteriota bacterium]